MKRYFIALFALVLAVGFTAFTVAKEKKAPVTLKFIGDPTSEPSVETESNWQELSISCSGASRYACLIVVDDQYVDNSSPRKLLSSVNLDAVQVTGYGFVPATGQSFITSITDKQTNP